jgi:hypothetical protein
LYGRVQVLEGRMNVANIDWEQLAFELLAPPILAALSYGISVAWDGRGPAGSDLQERRKRFKWRAIGSMCLLYGMFLALEIARHRE